MQTSKPIYFAATILFLFLISLPVLAYLKTEHKVVFGAYDPDKILDKESVIRIESVFFQWNEDAGNLKTKVRNIEKKGRIPMVNLEPWPNPLAQNSTYLTDVTKGMYDTVTKNICTNLSTSTPTILRWGHEMELTNSRYPWSGKNGADYIAAYKHFVTLCRKLNPQIKFVWSPSGEELLKKYWPGSKYVDFIGLSAYSFKEWDEKNVGHQRSFKELFAAKYKRIKGYNKPIIISESGATGSEEYRIQWYRDMITEVQKYNKIYAYMYFISYDTPGAWGTEYATPDWHITLDMFKKIQK